MPNLLLSRERIQLVEMSEQRRLARRELRQSSSSALNRFRATRLWRSSFLVALVALAVTMLACGVIQNGLAPAADGVVFRTRLPTITRTPLPTLTSTPLSSTQAVALAVESTEMPPAAVAAPLSAATPIPGAPSASDDASDLNASPLPTEPLPMNPTGTPPAPLNTAPTGSQGADKAGWAFAGVQNFPDQDGGNLVLYGDMVNNTGSVQQVSLVTGTFFDAQGQIVADGSRAVDYWPVDIIPPRGRVPFELTVYGIQSIANFDLTVEAEQSAEILRQDFQFLDLNQSNDGESYCLTGRLQNPGDQLQNYVVIVAVLYDDQDNVINFGEFYDPAPANVVGNVTLDFDICVAPVKLNVARYELRAWGG